MGMWNELARELRRRLVKEQEVRLTIDRIIRMTGTRETEIRSPGLWEAVRKGAEAYRAFADEGIAIEYEVVGGKVKAVTFRLAWLPSKKSLPTVAT